jgi:iron complex transport system ATP-binding protein
MNFDFPGATASLDPEVMMIHSQDPLRVLTSAVIGGDLRQTQLILNRHVDKHYDQADPVADLYEFAHSRGIRQPFVGLMTAVKLADAQAVTLAEAGLRVTAVVTAGVKSNPSAAGLSAPAPLRPGTINIILLLAANLTSPAMVNAVITATEAKTHTLLASGLQTPEGYPATGTSTDAIVVACTGQGDPLAYAGPATPLGWLIGRSVRQALRQALEQN